MDVLVAPRKMPMFKLIPWMVKQFRNRDQRLRELIQVIIDLGYEIEVTYETDENHNEHLVYWISDTCYLKDELIPKKVD